MDDNKTFFKGRLPTTEEQRLGKEKVIVTDCEENNDLYEISKISE